MGGSDGREEGVLASKRTATRYQILVELTARQPAVSQSEIAEAIGITAQAVSEYLQDLVARDHVRKLGRGRYEVTKEGVDWLISQTAILREYTEYVSEEVVGQVDTVAAIATDDIDEGRAVSLTMRGGTLHATPGDTGSHTAVAITEATAGAAVGVTDFQGLLEYDFGQVTIISIPSVTEGRVPNDDLSDLSRTLEEHDLVAVAGTEAEAVATALDREPDIRFGTAEAVREAAAKGVDVAVLAVSSEQSAITDRLREQSIGYEVLEMDGS